MKPGDRFVYQTKQCIITSIGDKVTAVYNGGKFELSRSHIFRSAIVHYAGVSNFMLTKDGHVAYYDEGFVKDMVTKENICSAYEYFYLGGHMLINNSNPGLSIVSLSGYSMDRMDMFKRGTVKRPQLYFRNDTKAIKLATDRYGKNITLR